MVFVLLCNFFYSKGLKSCGFSVLSLHQKNFCFEVPKSKKKKVVFTKHTHQFVKSTFSGDSGAWKWIFLVDSQRKSARLQSFIFLRTVKERNLKYLLSSLAIIYYKKFRIALLIITYPCAIIVIFQINSKVSWIPLIMKWNRCSKLWN